MSRISHHYPFLTHRVRRSPETTQQRKGESHGTKRTPTELFLRHVVPSDGRTCLQRQRRQPGGLPQAHHNGAQIWKTAHCPSDLYPRWFSLCGYCRERWEAAPSWLVIQCAQQPTGHYTSTRHSVERSG